MFSGAAHQCVCHGFVGDGEFELVALQLAQTISAALETGLDHLAFVGFENDALSLDVVDVAGVDSGALDEEETEVYEQCERQQEDEGLKDAFHNNTKVTKTF